MRSGPPSSSCRSAASSVGCARPRRRFVPSIRISSSTFRCGEARSRSRRGRAAIRFRARDSHRRAGGLNFLGRLSVSRLSPDATPTRSPGLGGRSSTRARPPRPACTKHAVACGGGRNHRFGLDDGVLVKDNHIRATGSIAQAVESLRASTPLPIEVECDTLDQVAEALASDADAILLDNMSLDDLRSAVASPAVARGSKPRAESRSTTSAPSPRPESTRSPSARSPTPHVPSTSHWS